MGLMDITEAQYGELIEAEKDEPIKTEAQKDEEFLDAYFELCQEHGRVINTMVTRIEK